MVESALSASLAAGLTVEAFFASTPYLTSLHAQAVNRARDHLAVKTAWHAEAFARTKELPDLAELLADEREDATPARDEARAWAERWGLQFQTVH